MYNIDHPTPLFFEELVKRILKFIGIDEQIKNIVYNGIDNVEELINKIDKLNQ